ncbi:bifunctional diguanylate cyclase/phosphodiesterase [Nitrincola sp. MINF-07-Sa-05]|uniref:bifunctional diguanylate cyclase/phosphodiesterase n=1 Tax=Nitrincola salilacus TaxID=3400273 RepID=UPI003917D1E2
MSEQEEKQDDLKRRLEFERHITQVSTHLLNVKPESFEQSIHAALADIGIFFKVDRAYLFAIDHIRQTQSLTHEWYADGIQSEQAHLQNIPLSHFPWIKKKLFDNQVVHIPDVAALPPEATNEQQEFRREKIQSLILVPLFQAEHIAGFFGLDAVGCKQVWSEDIQVSLRLLGQVFANAFAANKLDLKMQRLAYHDALTGLPNRKLMEDRLAQAVARAARRQSGLAVLLLDLDDFKLVNDTLGHAAGDNLLCQVAHRLETMVRENDTVARMGGDEFVFLVEVDESDDASDIAERVLQEVSAPVEIDGHKMVTHMSIGISLYPDDGESPESLLRYADIAMYSAKTGGKNRFAYFDSSMDDHAQEVMSLRFELGEAINRKELVLHYLPCMDLASMKVCGIEALVRWNHPERGMLQPGSFLTLAERSDMIGRIDHWVMQSVTEQQSHWQSQHPELRLSLNLSVRELYSRQQLDHLIHRLLTLFDDLSCVELDIAESSISQNMELAIEHLNLIRQKIPEIRIAVDDFGAQLTSLSRLHQWPVDTLKLAPVYLSNLSGGSKAEGAKAEGVLHSLIDLGRNLGLCVIAEGVETSVQCDLLKRLGCERAQGYYFSNSLSSAQLEPWLIGKGVSDAV